MSADHYQKNRQIWYSQILHLAATCQKLDRKSTRLNSSHDQISYAVFCLKKKKVTNSVCGRLHPYRFSMVRRRAQLGPSAHKRSGVGRSDFTRLGPSVHTSQGTRQQTQTT